MTNITSLVYTFFLLLYAFLMMWLILDVHLEDSSKNRKIIAIILTVFMLVANIFVLLQYGFKTYSAFYPLLAQIPVFMIFFCLSRYRGMKLVFMFLSTIVFSSPPVIASLTIASFFGYNRIIRVVVQILCYPIMLFLIKRFFSPYFVYMLANCKKGWLGFSVIPALYYFMTFITSKYYYTPESWDDMKIYRISLCLLVFAVYLLMLYLFKQTREQLILQNESNIFRLQAEAATDKLERVSQSQEEMKEYRHDLRHHLQYINTCVENNRTEEVKAYISTLCKRIDSVQMEQHCENEAVNLIFSAYAKRAKENEISLFIRANLPEILDLPNIELCVIVGNVLENAINACDKMTDKTKKQIEIYAEMRKNKVFLSVKNPYEGEIQFEEGLPITSEYGHGIGIKSVMDIIKKRDGMCTFTAEDGIFSFMMLA